MKFITVKDYKNKKVFNENEKEDSIILLPSEYGKKLKQKTYPIETYDFIKFAELKKTELTISMPKELNESDTLVLHSDELWLPILKLIGNITLSVVTNLITDFIKFKFGQSCDLKSKNVHFKVVTSDEKKGKQKEISYDGPADKVTEMFEKIDVNKLMEE